VSTNEIRALLALGLVGRATSTREKQSMLEEEGIERVRARVSRLDKKKGGKPCRAIDFLPSDTPRHSTSFRSCLSIRNIFILSQKFWTRHIAVHSVCPSFCPGIAPIPIQHRHGLLPSSDEPIVSQGVREWRHGLRFPFFVRVPKASQRRRSMPSSSAKNLVADAHPGATVPRAVE
jgi:hypothetical protein